MTIIASSIFNSSKLSESSSYNFFNISYLVL
nr:MAG TPA: hypothetical protein [Caudoviricetes sp.]